MADLSKPPPPPPAPEPPRRELPGWAFTAMSFLFAFATLAHIYLDAKDDSYNGERITLGLGVIVLFTLGADVSRFLRRGEQR